MPHTTGATLHTDDHPDQHYPTLTEAEAAGDTHLATHPDAEAYRVTIHPTEVTFITSRH